MNLLRLEFRKLLPYRAFWVLMGLYAAGLFFALNMVQNITINNQTMGSMAYQLPQVWQTVAFVARFLNLLLGILVIVLVTDEYSFRTFRQQVIEGLSRYDLIAAKSSLIFVLALLSTLLVGAFSLFYGLTSTPETHGKPLFTDAQYLAGSFVQALAYMSFAMLVAMLLRKSGLSIVLFLLYLVLVEPIVRLQMPDEIDKYFPAKVIKALTPMPRADLLESAAGISDDILSVNEALAVGAAYTLLFLALSYVVLKVRDL